MNEAIRRVVTTQVFELDADELREWRLSQPGSYPMRNGQTAGGWSQRKAAGWMGVHWRTWQDWERGVNKVAEWAVRRIVEYSQSIDQKIDAMMA